MNESQHNPYIIPLSILISGTLIAGAVLYAGDNGFGRGAPAQLGAAAGANNAAVPTDTSTGLEAMKLVSGEDHIRGNPDAPVKIVEYSDTECPFCKRFHSTLEEVIDEYGKSGKVAWVYRHFPLDQLHSKARKEAEATECAAKLGGNNAFWAYLDRLMEITPTNNGLDPAELPKIAEFIGLDVEKFNDCLTSGAYAEKIEEHVQNAIASGGQGTPYSIIVAADGSKQAVNGAVPYATLKSQIEQALGQ